MMIRPGRSGVEDAASRSIIDIMRSRIPCGATIMQRYFLSRENPVM